MNKTYEKKCARLVQAATTLSYQASLRWVREHQVAFPEPMHVETRALRIVENLDNEWGKR